MMDQLQAGSEGRRQGWLVTSDGHTWVPLRACKVVTRRQFATAPVRQREALDKVEALPPVALDLLRRSKISEAVAKIGGAKVDLDTFLAIMLATWEAEANALREQWAQVYFMVDMDGNQQLDFDEFKHVRAMHAWGLWNRRPAGALPPLRCCRPPPYRRCPHTWALG